MASAAVVAGAFISTQAQAATPPAGTVITNQASASYLDSGGTQQIATSNTVQTIVQQVGSFTLSPLNNTKSGGAGSLVMVPYTITNTGNGTDTFTIGVTNTGSSGNYFSSVNVYADADGNGLPDSSTSLLASGTAITANGGSGSTSAISIASGASYKFVVVYTVPNTATGTWSSVGTITTTASNGSINYASLTQSSADTVNLTTGAAFSVTKAIGAPSVAAAGGGSWGTTPSSGKQGTLTTYTLTYANNGAASGNLYLKDTLPAGFTYVSGSSVWSSNPGSALTDAGGTVGNINFKSASGVIEAVVANVAAGATGTLSFQVHVNDGVTYGSSGATIGTSQTSNSANFSLQGCGTVTTVAVASNGTGCPSGTTISTTNVAAFTVLPTYAVKTGPTLDSTAGTPNGATDAVTLASIVAGGSGKFTIPVTNNGNSSDTFKLTTSNGTIAAANQFPAGTSYAWFASDGVTPLQNTAGGTGVDTGPVAAGATVNVVLQVSIPSTTTIASGANLQVWAVATSTGDSTKLDATTAKATAVAAGYVELTATASGTTGVDVGPGSSTVVQTISATAGGTGYSQASAASSAGNAVYDLYVENNDTGSLTFTLQASQTQTFPGNLPAGWTVAYYADAGSLAASVAGTPITTVTVAAGAQQHVYAVVTPAASSATATGQDVYFRVVSTGNAASTGGIVSDYMRDAINVAAASSRSFTLASAGNSQVSAGGSTLFAHTVTNTGTTSCGATSGYLTITAALSAADTANGWSTALYLDNGSTQGSIDASDTLITNGHLSALAVGQNVPILVRVFAPGGAAVNYAATITVTVADPDASPNCGTQVLSDIATVTGGPIAVTKYQALDSSCAGTVTPTSSASITAKPGECIVYKAIATNNGTAAVSNVSLNDAVPAWTTYGTTQPTTQCTTTGLSGTAASYSSTSTTVACGSSANSLQPGGTITLQYQVKVNP
jgi:uncharacterized repeat protein (TIGR01451 family)